MKNFAFAKIGKSIKFKTAYSPIGGDNEAPAFIQALALWNPDKTFYIVGRSDFSKLNHSEKLKLFPNENVIDVWDGPGRKMFFTCTNPRSKPRKDVYEYVAKWFAERNIKIDYGIFIFGQVGTVTIHDKIKQVNSPDLIASVVDMTINYTSPLTYWLNESQIPYMEIQNDPRYDCNQSRDLFNLPKLTYAQYDYTFDANHIQSYENQERILTPIHCSYKGMEVGYCFGKKKPPADITYNKTIKSMIVLNEGKPSRYKQLKEWILDHNEDIEIYGQWKCEEALSDNRFKGSRSLEELATILQKTKYTFIIPIAPGWVTSKYIEMIHNGVIPFFHPSYDDQKHILIPGFLRVKSPEDLKRKIEKLEAEPENYRKLLMLLQKTILHDVYYNGKFLSDTIMTGIYEQNNLVYKSIEELPEFQELDSIDDIC